MGLCLAQTLIKTLITASLVISLFVEHTVTIVHKHMNKNYMQLLLIDRATDLLGSTAYE